MYVMLNEELSTEKYALFIYELLCPKCLLIRHKKVKRGLRMENYRLYGSEPYRVVTVHGGPGALGDMYLM